MRAFIFDGKSVALHTSHPPPQPQPGDALVRPVRLGISSLDHEVARGLNDFKGVLGHEFVGVVESVESNDARELVGRRVVGTINSDCGTCDLCLRGLRTHCRSRTLLGINRDGCFAETFTLPAANLFPLPDSVDDDHAVFAHVLSCAIQAVRQLTIEGKPYITVLGDGPLGLLTVQLMSRLNASVRLIGRHPEKFGLCERWSAKHRHVDDIGRRADQDVVIDCTGSPLGLDLAMQLVRPRGKVLVKSLAASWRSATTNLMPMVVNEIELIGSHFGPMSEAVSLLSRREIDVVSLISRRSRFKQFDAAWSASQQPELVKMLVDV